MNTQPTLFSRYKNMINNLWADGQRKYTANELNTFVGQYENNTWWKRSNNNPFYTTRLYQTALKHLGCVTKIKRGLWEINAPIPEWFGSFHINALTNTGALKELEKSSFYWQSLPAEHKVNPWENIDPMRVIASTQQTLNTNNTNTMNKTTDCVMQTITGIALIEEFPQLTMTAQVSVYPAKDGGYGVDVCDWQYMVLGKEVTGEVAESICGAFGKDVLTIYTAAAKKLEQELINEAIAKDATIAKATATTNNGEKTYTKAQVEQILKAFAIHVAKDVESAIENECESLDESDCVDVDFDSFDRRINIELNTSSMARTLGSAASDQVDMSYDDFEIDNVEIK